MIEFKRLMSVGKSVQMKPRTTRENHFVSHVSKWARCISSGQGRYQKLLTFKFIEKFRLLWHNRRVCLIFNFGQTIRNRRYHHQFVGHRIRVALAVPIEDRDCH